MSVAHAWRPSERQRDRVDIGRLDPLQPLAPQSRVLLSQQRRLSVATSTATHAVGQERHEQSQQTGDTPVNPSLQQRKAARYSGTRPQSESATGRNTVAHRCAGWLRAFSLESMRSKLVSHFLPSFFPKQRAASGEHRIGSAAPQGQTEGCRAQSCSSRRSGATLIGLRIQLKHVVTDRRRGWRKFNASRCSRTGTETPLQHRRGQTVGVVSCVRVTPPMKPMRAVGTYW